MNRYIGKIIQDFKVKRGVITQMWKKFSFDLTMVWARKYYFQLCLYSISHWNPSKTRRWRPRQQQRTLSGYIFKLRYWQYDFPALLCILTGSGLITWCWHVPCRLSKSILAFLNVPLKQLINKVIPLFLWKHAHKILLYALLSLMQYSWRGWVWD